MPSASVLYIASLMLSSRLRYISSLSASRRSISLRWVTSRITATTSNGLPAGVADERGIQLGMEFLPRRGQAFEFDDVENPRSSISLKRCLIISRSPGRDHVEEIAADDLLAAAAVEVQHGLVDVQDLPLQVGDGHAVGEGVDEVAVLHHLVSLFGHGSILGEKMAGFNQKGGI